MMGPIPALCILLLCTTIAFAPPFSGHRSIVKGTTPGSSLFDDADQDEGPPQAILFEDVESELDELTRDVGGDEAKIASQVENLPLTDEEDRILTDREDRLFQYINNTVRAESCILVGVEDLSAARKARKASGDDYGSWTLDESMVEMRELIQTSGLSLQGEITQRLQEVNPRTYIGSGKVDEAKELLATINEKLERRGEGECCTVVFDAELSPGQQKALENAFNKKVIDNDFLGSDQEDVVKVVDRTALILGG